MLQNLQSAQEVAPFTWAAPSKCLLLPRKPGWKKRKEVVKKLTFAAVPTPADVFMEPSRLPKPSRVSAQPGGDPIRALGPLECLTSPAYITPHRPPSSRPGAHPTKWQPPRMAKGKLSGQEGWSSLSWRTLLPAGVLPRLQQPGHLKQNEEKVPRAVLHGQGSSRHIIFSGLPLPS